MVRKSKNDFVIEKEVITESDDESDHSIEEEKTLSVPPNSPVPKSKKKPYVFTEARKLSLAKGRETRKQNIMLRKNDLDELKAIQRKNKEDKLTKKVMDELDKNEISDEEEVIKKVKKNLIKTQSKKKKKKKVVVYSSSEEESEEEEIVYKKKPTKKKVYNEPIERQLPLVEPPSKYANYF